MVADSLLARNSTACVMISARVNGDICMQAAFLVGFHCARFFNTETSASALYRRRHGVTGIGTETPYARLGAGKRSVHVGMGQNRDGTHCVYAFRHAQNRCRAMRGPRPCTKRCRAMRGTWLPKMTMKAEPTRTRWDTQASMPMGASRRDAYALSPRDGSSRSKGVPHGII